MPAPGPGPAVGLTAAPIDTPASPSPMRAAFDLLAVGTRTFFVFADAAVCSDDVVSMTRSDKEVGSLVTVSIRDQKNDEEFTPISPLPAATP